MKADLMETEILDAYKELTKTIAVIGGILRSTDSEISSILVSARYIECMKRLPKRTRDYVFFLELKNRSRIDNALNGYKTDGKSPLYKQVCAQYGSFELFNEEEDYW